MPRHLISDAHEWINEIPTVPTLFPKFSLSSFSPPGGRFFSPATVPRAAPHQQLSGAFPSSHVVMVEPPPHVPPPPFVPPTVPPLSSSFPSLSSSKPRSETHQNSVQPPLSSDPSPPPPPPPTNPAAAVNPDTLSSGLLPAQRSALSPSDLSDPNPQTLSSAAAPAPPSFPSLLRGQSSSSTIDPAHQTHPNPQNQPPLLAPPSSQPLSARPSPVINPSGASLPLQQLSYAQVARGPRGPGFVRSHASDVESFARLPRTGVNVICGSREGLPSFSFVNADLPKVESLYSKALVMKFHGGRPSLENSHKEISSWGIEHPFSIGPLSSRSFLLRFQDEKDLLKVLSRPSSTLITFAYRVFRWHNLCHLKEDSCLAPVWISLPKLPLQCFVPEFLESIGNKLGRFLCLDKATATLARPSAARLCVELDLRKQPTQFIWIGLFEGFKQQIMYERLPKFCNGCLIQGHTSMECSKRFLDNPQLQTVDRNQVSTGGTQTVRSNATTKQISANHHNFNPLPPPINTLNPTNSIYPVESSNPPAEPSNQNTSSHHPGVMPHPSATHNTNTHHFPENQPLIKPATPHKPPSTSSLKKRSKHTRKSVAFAPSQSNIEANQEFWNAVDQRVAQIEQDRMKAPMIDTGSSPISSLSAADPTKFPEPSEAQDTSTSGDSDSGSSVPDSQQNSPSHTIQDAQNPYEDIRSTSFDSEGEGPTAEPSSIQGHNSDDMLTQKPHSSKRNKRHPNQPLNIQLRARKDPNPSTLC